MFPDRVLDREVLIRIKVFVYLAWRGLHRRIASRMKHLETHAKHEHSMTVKSLIDAILSMI